MNRPTALNTLEQLIATCRMLARTRGTTVTTVTAVTASYRLTRAVVRLHNFVIHVDQEPGSYVAIWQSGSLVLSQGKHSGNFLDSSWLSVADDILQYAILDRLAVESGATGDSEG